MIYYIENKMLNAKLKDENPRRFYLKPLLEFDSNKDKKRLCGKRAII